MNDFFLALFLLGISVTVNIGLALAWLSSHRRLRQLETRPVDLSQLDDLIARVDTSLGAVSERLDDLVSSQDFMNRVLTDRLDRLDRALPPPEHHNTPV
jgi:hypothetical protein